MGYYGTAEEANTEYVKARQAQVNVLKEKKLYSIAIMVIAFLADFVLDVNVIYIIAAGILAGTIRFIWMRKIPKNISLLMMPRRTSSRMCAIWKSSQAKAPTRPSAITATCAISAAL